MNIEMKFPKGTILVELRFSDNEVLARFENAGIFASGSSVEEALAALKSSIEEDYNYLWEHREVLGNMLRERLILFLKSLGSISSAERGA